MSDTVIIGLWLIVLGGLSIWWFISNRAFKRYVKENGLVRGAVWVNPPPKNRVYDAMELELPEHLNSLGKVARYSCNEPMLDFTAAKAACKGFKERPDIEPPLREGMPFNEFVSELEQDAQFKEGLTEARRELHLGMGWRDGMLQAAEIVESMSKAGKGSTFAQAIRKRAVMMEMKGGDAA